MNTSGERFVPGAGMGMDIEIEHLHRYEAIAPKLEGLVVLDAACGTGYGSKIISRYARRVVGIDISEEAIAYADKNYSDNKIEFLRKSILEMDFEPNSFDAVVSFETIEHISESQQKIFLEQIKRVLKKDGILIMSTPEHDTFVRKSVGTYFNPFHIKEFNQSEYECFLHNYFKYVSIHFQERLNCSVIEGKKYTAIGEIKEFNNGDYMIAVCSDRNTELNFGSVWLPSADDVMVHSFMYIDDGEGYSESNKVCMVSKASANGIVDIETQIGVDNVKKLRFDPVDFPAKIRIIEFEINGNETEFSNNNSDYSEDERQIFYHWDPQYELTVPERKELLNIRISFSYEGILPTTVQSYLGNKANSAEKNAQELNYKIQEIEANKMELERELNRMQELHCKMQEEKKHLETELNEMHVLQKRIQEVEEEKKRLEVELSEMHGLQKRMQEAEEEKKRLEIELSEMHVLQNKMQEAEEEKKRLEAKLSEMHVLQNKIQEVEAEKKYFEGRLSSVYASTSWKITEPLRKLGRYLAARKGGNNSNNNIVNQPVNLEYSLCYRKPINEIEIPIEWLDILPHQYTFSIIFAMKNCNTNRSSIEKALKSCAKQKYKNIELIIVCSESEKCAADEIVRLLCLEKTKIVTFSLESTSITEAWSLGLEKATGDFVGILRQEDFFADKAFSYFVELLNENPTTKIISCYNAVDWDGEVKFVDYQEGINCGIGAEEKVRSFALFARDYSEYLIEKTGEVQNIVNDENYMLIPDILYFSTPTKSAWENSKVRCLAFYLPQFHEIPENNKWWGDGFTEWTNVKKSQPQFEGHYQPRVPGGELGYYDLGDDNGFSVQMKQIELAKKFGLSGFCYYYYWFDDGKRLLEKPLDRHLNNKEMDFPFCLCWANENWTRAWDGQKSEVLMPQTYKHNWEKKFVEDLIPYINDTRYIRVNGDPFLLIYNIAEIKNAEKSINKIRRIASEHGIKRIHISAVRRTADAREFAQSGYTLDSLTDFPPHLLGEIGVDHDNEGMFGMEPGHVKDYRKASDYHANMGKQYYTYFRTAMLEWDNTPRRGNKAFIFEDFSFESYKKWLYAIKRYTERQNRSGEDLMFINAWNEWAEGTVLEPDEKNGYKALETTKEVLEMR